MNLATAMRRRRSAGVDTGRRQTASSWPIANLNLFLRNIFNALLASYGLALLCHL
jgi:hypothetical protein